MRRRLLLVRHAKSAWDDPALADHDRPLAERGERALPRLRAHLDGAGLRPDHVLCSSARRTRQTLDGIRPLVPAGVPIEVDRGFYLASAPAILDRVRRLGDAVACAWVIGHNPTMQDLGLLLAGDGDPGDLEQLRRKLPTGAAVTLSFDGAWSGLAAGRADLDDLFTPRPPRD